jgi:hypothetical protein
MITLLGYSQEVIKAEVLILTYWFTTSINMGGSCSSKVIHIVVRRLLGAIGGSLDRF